VLAIILLIPPTRAFVRRVLRRWFLGRIEVFRGPAGPSRPPTPPEIDV
jgi:UPF0716 family protein affecting phage T7 exclusion